MRVDLHQAYSTQRTRVNASSTNEKYVLLTGIGSLRSVFVVRVRVGSEFSITFSRTRARRFACLSNSCRACEGSFANSLILVRPWQAKLQQQCALQRVEVVVGNQVNQSSGPVLLNSDTLEVVESQRRVEPKQLLADEQSVRPYALSSNPF